MNPLACGIEPTVQGVNESSIQASKSRFRTNRGSEQRHRRTRMNRDRVTISFGIKLRIGFTAKSGIKSTNRFQTNQPHNRITDDADTRTKTTERRTQNPEGLGRNRATSRWLGPSRATLRWLGGRATMSRATLRWPPRSVPNAQIWLPINRRGGCSF